MLGQVMWGELLASPCSRGGDSPLAPCVARPVSPGFGLNPNRGCSSEDTLCFGAVVADTWQRAVSPSWAGLSPLSASRWAQQSYAHAVSLLFLSLDISFYSSFWIRNQNKNKQPDENETSDRTIASEV